VSAFRYSIASVVFVGLVGSTLPAQQAAVARSTSEKASADSAVVWPQPIAPASSRHIVHAGRLTIPYQVTWSSMSLKTSSGIPQATISATTYLREDIDDRAARPVIFAFNGGPGASSSPLHFGILGPRRLAPADAKDSPPVIDNSETLLDAADLVLIDPVGTGFSRELRADGGRPYWNPEGDANSVLKFIRQWLNENNRGTSPIYIVGESYGGFRLAEMAKDLGDLNVAGLILVSPGMDFSGEAALARDQEYVFALPSMAAAAYAHRKAATEVRSVEQAFDEARAFAQSDYVIALQQGSTLDAQDRDRLADRMSKLIGLPASAVAAANLRIDTQDFLEQLMPGEVVGRIDTRVAAPKPGSALVAGRPKAADDPALHMGASNLIKNTRVRDYLLNEVGVKTKLDYVSLTLDVNFAWNWNSGSHKIEDELRSLSVASNLAKLMKEKPAVQMLLLSGYYDLATPVLYQQYVLTHSGVPLERTHMITVEAGHTVYEDGAREQVSGELHKFVLSGRNQ
jgi:carboxypeptidase C (cathepsin A)